MSSGGRRDVHTRPVVSRHFRQGSRHTSQTSVRCSRHARIHGKEPSMTTMAYRPMVGDAASELRLRRSDIAFCNNGPDRICIDLVIRNPSTAYSRGTEAEIHAAPLGAFVAWRPLTTVRIPPIPAGAGYRLRATARYRRAPRRAWFGAAPADGFAERAALAGRQPEMRSRQRRSPQSGRSRRSRWLEPRGGWDRGPRASRFPC